MIIIEVTLLYFIVPQFIVNQTLDKKILHSSII